MAQITITFQEEGQASTQIIIPAEAANALEQHVAYLQQNGVPLTGKTMLFAKMTWDSWLKSLMEMYQVPWNPTASGLTQQRQQLEQQLAALKQQEEMAKMLSVIQVNE